MQLCNYVGAPPGGGVNSTTTPTLAPPCGVNSGAVMQLTSYETLIMRTAKL